MVVEIKIGRRVPRNWTKRIAMKIKGLLTFQENIWLIIERSLTMAKKKCAHTPNGGTFIKQHYRDMEDLYYDLEWIEVRYIGNPTQEEEEYNEALKMFEPLKTAFKNNVQIEDNKDFVKAFKTARLNLDDLNKTYKTGYDSSQGKSIQQLLLELGIITSIKKLD
jgi:hypothetical protein